MNESKANLALIVALTALTISIIALLSCRSGCEPLPTLTPVYPTNTPEPTYTVLPTHTPTPIPDVNLLCNPSFEGEYHPYNDGSQIWNTAMVAGCWTPWWVRQPPDAPAWQYRMPEWKNAAPYSYRIHSGNAAQQWFTFYGTHRGGIYQVVRSSLLHDGACVSFSAWVQVWSSSYDDPYVSQSHGNVLVRLGIDPYGGADASSSDVIWQDFRPYEDYMYDRYNHLSVDAVAHSNTITVFVWTEPEWAVKHNDIYIDDAELVLTHCQ